MSWFSLLRVTTTLINNIKTCYNKVRIISLVILHVNVITRGGELVLVPISLVALHV